MREAWYRFVSKFHWNLLKIKKLINIWIFEFLVIFWKLVILNSRYTFLNLRCFLYKRWALCMEKIRWIRFEIQVALVIRVLFICEFAYSRFKNGNQTSVFAIFSLSSLAYMRFSQFRAFFLFIIIEFWQFLKK